ncbi:hypothetical protein UC34_04975 [Pandoraea vervacti]|uniref:Uncharacterized protein n=1 Tax=Pandoraea vervacti TaxID=656178 RepID=A0ABN4FX09_9BURK|nr:hypothetical protein UC34_04975 [Pandoraea vervacti]
MVSPDDALLTPKSIFGPNPIRQYVIASHIDTYLRHVGKIEIACRCIATELGRDFSNEICERRDYPCLAFLLIAQLPSVGVYATENFIHCCGIDYGKFSNGKGIL